MAGVSAVAATRAPTLADFLPTANAPNTTDVSRDRTLVPASQNLTLNGVLSQPSVLGSVLTLNGTLGATIERRRRKGLGGFDLLVTRGRSVSRRSARMWTWRAMTPLSARCASARTAGSAHLGGTLNKDTATWRYSLTSAYDHGDTLTRTDAGTEPGGTTGPARRRIARPSTPSAPLPDDLIGALPETKARSLSDSANIQALANGPAIKLPAGDLYTSLKVGRFGQRGKFAIVHARWPRPVEQRQPQHPERPDQRRYSDPQRQDASFRVSGRRLDQR